MSYSASLDANEGDSEVILSTDRNLLTNRFNMDGRLFLASSNVPAASWTTNHHDIGGNFAMADGSVQHASATSLASQIALQGIATNRLLLPLFP